MTQLRGDPGLHAKEPVPTADHQPPPPAGLSRQSDPEIPGDGMMDRRHHRQTRALEIQNAVGKGLVVVHHVKFVGVIEQPIAHTLAKRLGLGKPSAELAKPFFTAKSIDQLCAGHAPEISRVQVETRQLNQLHALDQMRIRRARDHGDLMPQLDKRLAEVAQIDALPP